MLGGTVNDVVLAVDRRRLPRPAPRTWRSRRRHRAAHARAGVGARARRSHAEQPGGCDDRRAARRDRRSGRATRPRSSTADGDAEGVPRGRGERGDDSLAGFAPPTLHALGLRSVSGGAAPRPAAQRAHGDDERAGAAVPALRARPRDARVPAVRPAVAGRPHRRGDPVLQRASVASASPATTTRCPRWSGSASASRRRSPSSPSGPDGRRGSSKRRHTQVDLRIARQARCVQVGRPRRPRTGTTGNAGAATATRASTATPPAVLTDAGLRSSCWISGAVASRATRGDGRTRQHRRRGARGGRGKPWNGGARRRLSTARRAAVLDTGATSTTRCVRVALPRLHPRRRRSRGANVGCRGSAPTSSSSGCRLLGLDEYAAQARRRTASRSRDRSRRRSPHRRCRVAQRRRRGCVQLSGHVGLDDDQRSRDDSAACGTVRPPSWRWPTAPPARRRLRAARTSWPGPTRSVSPSSGGVHLSRGGARRPQEEASGSAGSSSSSAIAASQTARSGGERHGDGRPLRRREGG